MHERRRPLGATPVSKPRQLPHKQPTFETSIDLNTIVVGEEQKLPSRLGCDQGVPTKLKRELDRLGQMFDLVWLELMAGGLIQSAVLIM